MFDDLFFSKKTIQQCISKASGPYRERQSYPASSWCRNRWEDPLKEKLWAVEMMVSHTNLAPRRLWLRERRTNGMQLRCQKSIASGLFFLLRRANSFFSLKGVKDMKDYNIKLGDWLAMPDYTWKNQETPHRYHPTTAHQFSPAAHRTHQLFGRICAVVPRSICQRLYGWQESWADRSCMVWYCKSFSKIQIHSTLFNQRKDIWTERPHWYIIWWSCTTPND